jgi:hypothetical protein
VTCITIGRLLERAIMTLKYCMNAARLKYCNTIASILPTAIDIGLVTHIATVNDTEFAIAITCNLLLPGYGDCK